MNDKVNDIHYNRAVAVMLWLRFILYMRQQQRNDLIVYIIHNNKGIIRSLLMHMIIRREARDNKGSYRIYVKGAVTFRGTGFYPRYGRTGGAIFSRHVCPKIEGTNPLRQQRHIIIGPAMSCREQRSLTLIFPVRRKLSRFIDSTYRPYGLVN